MSNRGCGKVLSAMTCATMLTLAPIDLQHLGAGSGWQFVTLSAQADNVPEKEAFEAAKELGTIEAWDAFLNSYSTGFRADLARAYVRRLGGNSSGGGTSRPQATTAPAEPQGEAQLSTYAAQAGTSAWQTTRYEMDEGNASATAASVNAGGLEFLLYCDADKRLSAILREGTPGEYPEFNRRITQGLDANRRANSNREFSYLPMGFSSGAAYSLSAVVQGLTGEVSIGEFSDGRGFQPGGKIVRDMLKEDAFSLFAPPFEATFQLTNSRKSICAVTSQCGTSAPGC